MFYVLIVQERRFRVSNFMVGAAVSVLVSLGFGYHLLSSSEFI